MDSMSDDEDLSLYGKMLLSKYKVINKLGNGGFGRVYYVEDIESKNYYAAKLENIESSSAKLLEKEANILKNLQSIGIPQFISYGKYDKYNILIMELLGQSLQKLFLSKNKKLSLKTVCMLGIQMVDRIEYIHYKNIIHGDLKPENFAMGIGQKDHILYCIDFGFNSKYWNSKNKCHIPFQKKALFVGNPRFCSINALKGLEVSRRDELESIGYIIMYLLRGDLPWQILKFKNREDFYHKIREKKRITSVKELCSGFPSELGTFISYTKNLEFTEAPDYNYLRYLLKNIMKKSGFTLDFNYDWSYKKPKIKNDDPIFRNDIIKYDKSKEWLFNPDYIKKDCIGMDLV